VAGYGLTFAKPTRYSVVDDFQIVICVENQVLGFDVTMHKA